MDHGVGAHAWGTHDRVVTVGGLPRCGHEHMSHLPASHLLPEWHHVLHAGEHHVSMTCYFAHGVRHPAIDLQ